MLLKGSRQDMFRYGIMQGRLTAPMGREIQFFPFENWQKEFTVAADLGLDEIEFIFDYEDYEKNPLWTEAGRKELKKVIDAAGVRIHAVCFDYFMRRAFYKADNDRNILKSENENILLKIFRTMKELEIGLLEIPLVDGSSLKSFEEKTLFQNFILDVVKKVPSGIKIGLETDMPPYEFREYLEVLDCDVIGANYDSGNSSGLGYDPYEEITVLGDKIFNIHIKDRKYMGQTVQLGTGSADFERLFVALREIKYKGAFILQAARGEEGKEKENIAWQLCFLKKYVDTYL